MIASYPRRNSHHAHRLTRLLFKSCAAQTIGHHSVCLIVHVAHTEDAARYQGPVRFWNGQLMETLGFNSPKQLINARSKAVDAGWLCYERANDRAVGHYWTTIPTNVSRFDDQPIEPAEHPYSHFELSSHSGKHSESGKDIHSEFGTQSGTHGGIHSGKPSNPTPNPIPNMQSQSFDSERSPKAKLRKSLTRSYHPDFEHWWSQYPKHVEKPEAAIAFVSALQRIQAEMSINEAEAVAWLVERTRRYAESVSEFEPRFIKHPGPWLNADRFNDDVAVVEKLSCDAYCDLPVLNSRRARA